MPHEDKIVRCLWDCRDQAYGMFQRKLIPNIEGDRIIGVRTPQLRSLAKEIAGSEEAKVFLQQLPHHYFEENQLHAFLLCLEKDYETCLEQVNDFLPYVNNWATCDQMSPKVFGRHKQELLSAVDRWLDEDKPYTVRFAIGMLMTHYLDADFHEDFLCKVAAVQSPWSRRGDTEKKRPPSGDDYYIHMMVAWYFATALAKQWDATLPYLEGQRLDRWTHNKTIQKAVESYRVSAEHKEYLKTLRIRNTSPASVGR